MTWQLGRYWPEACREYMFIFSVVALSFFCTLLITPLVARYAANRRIYDLPGGRRVHTRPVPRLGGVSLFIALLASMVVILPRVLENENGLGDEAKFFIGTLVGATIIFAVGLRDDLKALRPTVKLLFQIVAAVAVHAFGVRIEALHLGPATTVATGWFALPLTLFWIIGVTNAINLIDGLDGLATGIALVALAATIAVGTITEKSEVVIMALAAGGSLAAFLIYNFNPARIFLGDSGSYLIGFLLAVLAIQGSFKSGAATFVAVPALVIGLPILDVALAITRRWLRGVPIFGADAGHIHHRLLAIGFTHKRAVLVMYAVATLLAVIGVLVVMLPPVGVLGANIGGAVVILILFGYGMRRLDYHEFEALRLVIVRGVLRVRRQVAVRIQVQELGRMINKSSNLSQVRTILAARAEQLGVSKIEFRPDAEKVTLSEDCPDNNFIMIEAPITCQSMTTDTEHRYTLRVWCGRTNDNELSQGEWLVKSLAPVLESLIERDDDILQQSTSKHDGYTPKQSVRDNKSEYASVVSSR